MKDIIEIIKNKALEKGDFTLASGEKTSYYFNLKGLMFDSIFQEKIAKIISDYLYSYIEKGLDSIGGPEIGAIAPTINIINHLGKEGIILNGFVVRKKTKNLWIKENY